MLRSYLYEAANVLLTRVAKWSALKAWGVRLAKRSGLVPGAQAIAVMVDPNIPGSQAQAKEAQEAMANIGVRPLVMAVNSERDSVKHSCRLAS